MIKPPTALVINAGSHPEPIHFAVGVAKAGFEVTYVTASLLAYNSIVGTLIRFLPLTKRLRALLLRRTLPASTSILRVKGFARLPELLATFAGLRNHEAFEDLVKKRMDVFNRKVSNFVGRSSEPDLIVAQQTGALEAFMATSQAFKVLLYPIAHHSWMEQHLSEEGQTNPNWSLYLQSNSLTPSQRTRLNREIELADVVIVPSSFARQTFLEAGVEPSKVIWQSLGWDELTKEKWGKSEIQTKQPDSPALNVLFAGQVNQRKGIGYLLEAIDSCPQGSISLTVIGRVSESLKNVIHERYSFATCVGTLPKSALTGLMASHDITVLPSLAEGFGLVALESMAEGTPVIVSEATFASDIIQDGHDGWIVPSRDSRRLAELLQTLFLHREIVEDAGRRAKDKAGEHTWGKYSDKVKDLLVLILGDTGL